MTVTTDTATNELRDALTAAAGAALAAAAGVDLVAGEAEVSTGEPVLPDDAIVLGVALPHVPGSRLVLAVAAPFATGLAASAGLPEPATAVAALLVAAASALGADPDTTVPEPVAADASTWAGAGATVATLPVTLETSPVATLALAIPADDDEVVTGDGGAAMAMTDSTATAAAAPTPAAASFPDVVAAANAEGTSPITLLRDVEMQVSAELGRARMRVADLLGLRPGSIVELDRTAGTPVDVLVNGTLIARAEVVVIDEEYGLRITEIVGSHEQA